MDMLPQDGRIYVVDCPHSLQRYVGCSDGTAKTLARLFYELAIDPTTLGIICRSTVAPEHASLFLAEYSIYVRDPTTSYRKFLDLLGDFDIFATPKGGRLLIKRYERPIYPEEYKDRAKKLAYMRDVKHDCVTLPVHIPEILRAFGEFTGLTVRRDIVERNLGFYNDPAAGCEICKRKYRTN